MATKILPPKLFLERSKLFYQKIPLGRLIYFLCALFDISLDFLCIKNGIGEKKLILLLISSSICHSFYFSLFSRHYRTISFMCLMNTCISLIQIIASYKFQKYCHFVVQYCIIKQNIYIRQVLKYSKIDNNCKTLTSHWILVILCLPKVTNIL